MEDEEMALAMAINMSMMEEKHEERLGLNEVIAVGERIVEEEEKVERRYEEEWLTVVLKKIGYWIGLWLSRYF